MEFSWAAVVLKIGSAGPLRVPKTLSEHSAHIQLCLYYEVIAHLCHHADTDPGVLHARGQNGWCSAGPHSLCTDGQCVLPSLALTIFNFY